MDEQISTIKPSHAPDFDRALRDAIEAELDWIPEVDSAAVGVSVEDGVVTLSGEVPTLHDRIVVVDAVERVKGVHVIADELHLPETRADRAGADLARAAKDVLEWTVGVPHDRISVEVQGHTIILTGTVDWNFQRVAAKKAMQRIRGVAFVDSRLQLTRRPDPRDISEEVRNAFARNAILDAHDIYVMVNGSEITLAGSVRSWAEKRQAEHTAWASPHVTAVHNDLIVDWSPR